MSNAGKSLPGNRQLPPIETRFKPGQSGNPNGRPKKAQQIVEKAQDNADKALTALLELMSSTDERVKLQAAMAILDRGLGKPKQTIEDGRKQEMSDFSIDELRSIAGVGSARAAPPQDGSEQPDRLQ